MDEVPSPVLSPVNSASILRNKALFIDSSIDGNNLAKSGKKQTLSY